MKKTKFAPTYRYITKNRKSKLTSYSDLFYDKELALAWYEKFGKNLEKHFGRTLIFKESKAQISI